MADNVYMFIRAHASSSTLVCVNSAKKFRITVTRYTRATISVLDIGFNILGISPSWNRETELQSECTVSLCNIKFTLHLLIVHAIRHAREPVRLSR